MAERDIFERYTDFIDDGDRQVFGWAFLLDDSGDRVYAMKRALLLGLKVLRESKNKQLRERSFTIWVGDDARLYYWIAINCMAAPVTNLLSAQFTNVAGYHTSEFARLAELSAIPRFRYERGQVIEYSDPELAGTWRVDDEDWYGTGLTILLRRVEPAFLVGGERYAGQQK